MNHGAGGDSSQVKREARFAIDEAYELFGLDEQADADALSKAYLRLRQRYQPDQNPDDPLAPAIVQYLDAAFARLMTADSVPPNLATTSHAIAAGAAPIPAPRKRWWAAPVVVAVAAVAMLAILLFSPASPVRGEPAGDAVAGRALWASISTGALSCVSCHGVNG